MIETMLCSQEWFARWTFYSRCLRLSTVRINEQMRANLITHKFSFHLMWYTSRRKKHVLEYQSAFRPFSQYSNRWVLVSAAISMKRLCVMPLASAANRYFFHLFSLSQSLTKMNVSETMRGKVNVNSLFVYTSFVSISSQISEKDARQITHMAGTHL